MNLPPGPDGLSPKQVAVCRLVALGYSYRRIGIMLKISERTAQRRVETIAERIPSEDDDLGPYQRVLVWSYWRFRMQPLRQSA